MGKLKDLSGMRFGRLIVKEFVGYAKSRHSLWLCKCDCGNEKIINSHSLKSGGTKSCGCYAKEIEFGNKISTKHGMSRTRIYNTWAQMKARCYNPKHKAYKHYGGRGITVCKEWIESFEAFYEWAISNSYASNLTIDRIDVNGNYEPSNCRWATAKEQANNTRFNRIIIFNGESMTLKQAAEKHNMSLETLSHRLKKGWGLEDALLKPIGISYGPHKY